MTATQPSEAGERPRASRPDLRFIFQTEDVTVRHTHPLLTVRADIAQWVALNHDGTVRTPYYERRGTQPGGHGLRNCVWTSRSDSLAGKWDSFALSAQAEGRAGWYGWHAEFREPFAVGLERAEAMVKVLRRVDSRLARIASQYGRPGGFAEWAARVHSAAGTRGAPPVRPPGQRPSGRLRRQRLPVDGHRRPPLLAGCPAGRVPRSSRLRPGRGPVRPAANAAAHHERRRPHLPGPATAQGAHAYGTPAGRQPGHFAPRAPGTPGARRRTSPPVRACPHPPPRPGRARSCSATGAYCW